MAVLSDSDRQSVWTQVMRDLSMAREPVTITKQDLRAALDAVDQWVSDNTASFNTAIPQPARGALSTPQKVRILLAVVSRRFSAGT